ncbi:MAG: hypothetical protein ABWZ15_05815 [Acidimicrobiia bacterium]
MLWFERQVVHALISDGTDSFTRDAVEAYVDATLRAMPEHLRAGVAAESLALGLWPRLERALGRGNDDGLRRRILGWKSSRIDLVRQYVRLLQSLVVFAEQELAPALVAGA